MLIVNSHLEGVWCQQSDASPFWIPNERRTYERVRLGCWMTGPFQSPSPSADTPFQNPAFESAEHHASSQSEEDLNANALRMPATFLDTSDPPESEREADPNVVSPVVSSFDVSAHSSTRSQTPQVEEDSATLDTRALISFWSTESLEPMSSDTAHHENLQHKRGSDVNAVSKSAYTTPLVSPLPDYQIPDSPSFDGINDSFREKLLREINSWPSVPRRDTVDHS